MLTAVALAAALLGYLAGSHFLLKRNTPSPVAAAPAGSPSPVRAEPSPLPLVQTPTRPAATPTPDARRLAPPGEYYLLNRISVTTESGVLGVNAGTKVLLLERQENGALKVTDGPDDFIVAASEITNDLDAAERAAHREPPPAAPTRQRSRPVAQPPQPE